MILFSFYRFWLCIIFLLRTNTCIGWDFSLFRTHNDILEGFFQWHPLFWVTLLNPHKKVIWRVPRVIVTIMRKLVSRYIPLNYWKFINWLLYPRPMIISHHFVFFWFWRAFDFVMPLLRVTMTLPLRDGIWYPNFPSWGILAIKHGQWI